MSDDLVSKLDRLREYFKSLGSVAVAYSSGVDSSFLLMVAKEVLQDRVVAVTVATESFTEVEEKECIKFCRDNDIKHKMCYVNQLDISGFSDNPVNRCYLCKKVIFENIKKAASEYGIENVAEGSNLDDLGDYRPGLKAIEEMGVLSPLIEVGLDKFQIRQLSEEMGLYTYNKPSFACLSSRVPYGEKITSEKLRMVELAEEHLKSLGFSQIRVRIHELSYRLARIEVGEKDFDKIIKEDIRKNIVSRLKKLGFSYIAIDLQGYRSGSMNEVL